MVSQAENPGFKSWLAPPEFIKKTCVKFNLKFVTSIKVRGNIVTACEAKQGACEGLNPRWTHMGTTLESPLIFRGGLCPIVGRV